MKKTPASESAAIIPPTHKDISLRAIKIWQSYGQPQGRDTEIWLEAERQLLGMDSTVKNNGRASVVAISFEEPVSNTKPRAATKAVKQTGTARSRR